MFVLVLNQNNIVQDGQNNKLIYRFPNTINLKDKYIAVSSISMFYSWFNIASRYSNNFFTYTWYAGTNPAIATPTVFTINIPDGLYEISELNNFIQYTCIQNNTYYTNSTNGNYVYPFEIVVNPNRYSIQLNTFFIPTTLPAGFSLPAGVVLPITNGYNTQVSFPSAFNSIVGYRSDFQSALNASPSPAGPFTFVPGMASPGNNYASINSIGTISYLSNVSPQVQPNNNVLLSLSNINNPYSQPSSIIYSFNPNVKVGEQISERPPNFMWNKMIDGFYNEIRLTFLGTDLTPLTINDPNMTILLTIKDKEESFGK